MKLKTKKAALKRVKIKKSGFERKKAYKAHLLRRKTTKQLRRLSEPMMVHPSDLGAFAFMLPYA